MVQNNTAKLAHMFIWGVTVGVSFMTILFLFATTNLHKTTEPEYTDLLVGNNIGVQIAGQSYYIQTGWGNAPGETLQRTQYATSVQGSY